MLRVKVTYQGLRFSAVIKSILPYNTVINEDKKIHIRVSSSAERSYHEIVNVIPIGNGNMWTNIKLHSE